MDEHRPSKDDTATLVALGVLAYALTDTVHEALGHGGVCLLQGGRIRLLTSAYFHGVPGSPWTDAGGPLANLLATFLFALLLRGWRDPSPPGRLFLRLLVAFNLFWASGQMIYSAVSGRDDWAFAIAGFTPASLWRSVLGSAGVALYAWGVSSLRGGLIRDGAPAQATRRRLLLPYAGAGLAACAAALFYGPDRYGALHEAALETFGANLGLLLAAGRSSTPPPGAFTPVPRRNGWLLAATLLFLLFAATLGRGLGA